MKFIPLPETNDYNSHGYYTLKTNDEVKIVTLHATLSLLSKADNDYAYVVLLECIFNDC